MEKDKKSPEMIETEKQMKLNEADYQGLINRRGILSDFVPQTEEGRQAHQEALKKIESELDTVQARAKALRSRLEVETVQYLASANMIA